MNTPWDRDSHDDPREDDEGRGELPLDERCSYIGCERTPVARFWAKDVRDNMVATLDYCRVHHYMHWGKIEAGTSNPWTMTKQRLEQSRNGRSPVDRSRPSAPNHVINPV